MRSAAPPLKRTSRATRSRRATSRACEIVWSAIWRCKSAAPAAPSTGISRVFDAPGSGQRVNTISTDSGMEIGLVFFKSPSACYPLPRQHLTASHAHIITAVYHNSSYCQGAAAHFTMAGEQPVTVAYTGDGG